MEEHIKSPLGVTKLRGKQNLHPSYSPAISNDSCVYVFCLSKSLSLDHAGFKGFDFTLLTFDAKWVPNSKLRRQMMYQ